jgi:hypothetical protein
MIADYGRTRLLLRATVSLFLSTTLRSQGFHSTNYRAGVLSLWPAFVFRPMNIFMLYHSVS